MYTPLLGPIRQRIRKVGRSFFASCQKFAKWIKCEFTATFCGVCKNRGNELFKKWTITHSIVLVLISLIGFTLYKVQYKTGIEILPFFPIDDSGFEVYNEELLESVDVSESARNQPKNGSIFCWVMTTNINHRRRVTAVNSTWLKDCDAGHFYTNNGRGLAQSVPYHGIFNSLPESYYKLFWKTRLALLYTYTKVSNKFDWYFKGDDDTYVIVENMRRYLKQFDPNKPYYFGYRLRRRMPDHGYNAGGSGYILSRAAMKLFAEVLFYDKRLCPYHEWEDLAIARCLASQKVFPQDTRDELGRQRFLAWRPEEHFNADLSRSFIFDPIDHLGFDIFHENLISLHHLSPEEIRLIHGLLYRVAPGVYNSTPSSTSAIATMASMTTSSQLINNKNKN